MNRPADPAAHTAMCRVTRRRFTHTLASSALGVLSVPAILRGRNLAEMLNIALVGVGGRGADNHKTVAGQGQNIVALCDVDENHLGEAARRSPRARTYHDFRKLFDELHGQIDAVIVSTPDHTHAVISKAALELGKHVYCEKPLTHSIHEARVLAATAARHKLSTQMGNIIRPTTRSSGAAGGILAPAPLETWDATSSTPPSGRSSCVNRGASRPRVRRSRPTRKRPPPGRSSDTISRLVEAGRRSSCSGTTEASFPRAGRRIEWDAAGGRITNGSIDNPFIHREYRPGWAL
jgi:hypothetical protein